MSIWLVVQFYRELVLSKCPSVKSLDGLFVTDDERYRIEVRAGG